MGRFDKLFNRKGTQLDGEIQEISKALIKKAKDQSWQQKINITEEAEKIGTLCGILRKEH